MEHFLPCLMLPLRDHNILLPSSAVSEIVSYEKPTDVEDLPTWLLGIFSWRAIHIPLVHIESIASHIEWNFASPVVSDDPRKNRYIAIINRSQKMPAKDKSHKAEHYPFFAIVLDNVPKLYHIAENDIKTLTQFPLENKRFLMEIKLQNDSALIPNLDSLWETIDALPSRLQWFRQIVL